MGVVLGGNMGIGEYIGEYNVRCSVGEYYKHIPKIENLFSCASFRGKRFVCGIGTTENGMGLRVAICDTQHLFFHREFSKVDVFEMREAIDVNKSIGWKDFFDSMVSSFSHHRIEVNFFDRDFNSTRICQMNIELSFSTIGRTNLQLKLRKSKTQGRVKGFFILPLFSFFNNNNKSPLVDRIEFLKRQIDLFKKKCSEYLSDDEKDNAEGAGRNDWNVDEREGKEIYDKRITERKKKKRNKLSVSDLEKRLNGEKPGNNAGKEGNGEGGGYGDGWDKSSGNSLNSGENFEDNFYGANNEHVFDKRAQSNELAIPQPNASAEEAIEFLKDLKRKLSGFQSHQFGIKDHTAMDFDIIINTLQHLRKSKLQSVSEFTQKYSVSEEQNLLDKVLEEKVADTGIVIETEMKDNEEEVAETMQKLSSFLEGTGVIKNHRIRENIMKLFDQVDDWEFDVFLMNEMTQGNSLFITSFVLFVRYDLLKTFNINEEVFVNFIREIQSKYHHNPYHNSMHAADVLQVFHSILVKGGLGEMLDSKQIFAGLLSCIIHDVDHPGLNNNFHKNTGSYLSILYNDRSVLENHHASQAFEIMRSKQNNILHNVDRETAKEIRKTAIALVLATDMTLHNSITVEFKTKLIKKFRDIDAEDESNPIVLFESDEIPIILKMAIKMADVSNPARPLCLYLQWVHRLMTENYQQGDKERDMGLQITALMDRYSVGGLRKGQITFLNYCVRPMFKSFSMICPKMGFYEKYWRENCEYWKNHDTIDEEMIRKFKKESYDRLRKKREEKILKKKIERKRRSEEKKKNRENALKGKKTRSFSRKSMLKRRKNRSRSRKQKN